MVNSIAMKSPSPVRRLRFCNHLVGIGFAALAALASSPATAQESRSSPFDVYVLIDRSSAMAGSAAPAAEWLCADLVDGRLIDGDRLTVWTFADRPEALASGVLGADLGRADLKARLRSIPVAARPADISAALDAAARAESARADRRLPAYVLLVSAFREDAAEADEPSGWLRFARIVDHPGWKEAVVGLNWDEKVRRAAAEYEKSAADADGPARAGYADMGLPADFGVASAAGRAD
jgi:hypothetical protein